MLRMWGIAIVLFAVHVSAWAQAPSGLTQKEQDQQRFNKAVAESVMPLRFEDMQFRDTGGAWLIGEAAKADILMLGEMHGVADIAHAAAVLARVQGATIYAAEVGETGVLKLAPMLKAKNGDLDAYMSDARRANSFAFLNMREEVDFARAVLQRSDNVATEIWGLDQEFITSGPLLMDRLETYARTKLEKDAVAKARAVIAPLFFSLGKIEPRVFEDLELAFAKGAPEAVTLIKDIALSNAIYAAQGYAQNAPREELMKRKFLMHWRRVTSGKGPAPKIVMKMGANHLQAGLSTMMVPALGGLVRNLALIENKTTFSVFLLCAPDGFARRFTGGEESCADELKQSAGSLAPHLRPEGGTVFRTAPLRAIAGTLKRLWIDETTLQYVFSYDALVVLNGAKAAQMFAPPDPTWFEGN